MVQGRAGCSGPSDQEEAAAVCGWTARRSVWAEEAAPVTGGLFFEKEDGEKESTRYEKHPQAASCKPPTAAQAGHPHVPCPDPKEPVTCSAEPMAGPRGVWEHRGGRRGSRARSSWRTEDALLGSGRAAAGNTEA